MRERRAKRGNLEEDYEYNLEDSAISDEGDIFDPLEVLDKLPKGTAELNALYNDVKSKIKGYKQQFLREQQDFKSMHIPNKVRKSYVG